ncbi:MAG: Ig-like domain-containing protein [Nitrospinae bacterium]|nr:Ig-like domain-containing protein [Nitrospinota bacterium]
MAFSWEANPYGDFYAEKSPVFKGLGPHSGRAMKISPSSVILGYGESITFLTVGGTQPITYSLSNKTFGSINSSGVFTAKKYQTKDKKFYVIAKDKRGDEAKAKVSIIKNSVEISPSVATLGYGNSLTFGAAGGYENSYTWTVSNASMGTIAASTGLFTAKNTTGSVTVRAKDSAGTQGTAIVYVVESGLTVKPSVVVLERGQAITFTASGGTGSYTWQVNDSNLGSIDSATGKFTASYSTGKTYISVTDSGGSKGTAEVEVIKAVVKVQPSILTITRGGTQTFTATGGTGTYFWTSSDVSLGNIIFNTGRFTALNTEGTLTINVEDSAGNKGSGSVTIIGTSVTVIPSTITVARGNTQQFSATGGTGTYFWTVSDQTLGAIDSAGLFTARATGTLKVTVSDSAGNTGTATVTITVTSLTVSPSTISVARGRTQQFSAAGGTGTYFWAVSDKTLGSIDSNGLFTASGGSGTLTVTASDSAGNTGTATVTVAASSLTVSPYTVTLGRRQTQQFTSTGGSGTVYWSVTDRTLGSISTTGLFTAKTTLGTTAITATDSLGNSGTASVTVDKTVLDISPPSWFVSNSVGEAGASTTNSFSVSGGSGSYYWSISNNTTTASYISPTHFSVSSPNTAVTNIITVTIPASNLGNQTLTVLVQDTYGDSGTATVTVQAK